MNDTKKEDHKKISWFLTAGIVLLPIIFSWFTLRKGYGKFARGLSLGWLAIFIAIVSLVNHQTPTIGIVSAQNKSEVRNEDPEQESSATNAVQSQNNTADATKTKATTLSEAEMTEIRRLGSCAFINMWQREMVSTQIQQNIGDVETLKLYLSVEKRQVNLFTILLSKFMKRGDGALTQTIVNTANEMRDKYADSLMGNNANSSSRHDAVAYLIKYKTDNCKLSHEEMNSITTNFTEENLESLDVTNNQ